MSKNFEISKLAALLGKYNIPFTICPQTLGEEISIQICSPNEKDCLIDAICHSYSFGGKDGLLEVMAHRDYEYVTNYDVVGYLSAKEALQYFRILWGK